MRRSTRRALLRAVAVLALALSPSVARADDAASFERALAAVASPKTAAADRIDAAGTLAAATAPADRARAVPPLLAALGDGAPRVRVAAADALARLGDERAIARLASRLPVESDGHALSSLLLAIGRLGRAEDATVVAPFARHAVPAIRAAAAVALGDLGGPAARERLLALLAEPGADADWRVRGSVLLALARCGTPADAGTVLVAYRDGGGAAQWFARAALAKAVAALDPDPVATLDRLAADDDARVSSAAALAFVRAGRPEEVLARLSDPRPGVRAACAAAVAEAELRKALPRLRALATGDPVRAVRWSATLALSRLDDPSSDGLLVAGLSSDDPQVWAAALAECRRKVGAAATPGLGRDPAGWEQALAKRRAGLPR
jgi:HEAT repeat protein